LPPPGADQLEAIHLEVSSDPLEKLSKNVAPAGAAGPLARNVLLARKRVASTKMVTFMKISLSYRGWGLASQSLVAREKIARA